MWRPTEILLCCLVADGGGGASRVAFQQHTRIGRCALVVQHVPRAPVHTSRQGVAEYAVVVGPGILCRRVVVSPRRIGIVGLFWNGVQFLGACVVRVCLCVLVLTFVVDTW